MINIVKIKKRRQRCNNHKATGRNWDEYILGYLDYNGTEVWRCKQCKEEDDKWLANYEIKKEEERIEREERWRKQSLEIAKREEERKIKMKEELWDCVVKRELLRGVKNSYRIELPKELLQLKRATIKLQRLVDKNKKEETDKKKQIMEEKNIIERNKRLPYLVCSKHGNIFAIDAIKSGLKPSGAQNYKCRKCMKEIHRSNYKRNKEKILNKCAEYRQKNPEKIKEMRIKYKEKINVTNK